MPGAGGPAHVAVAGERVADQHGVVARGVELAPGLERETDAGKGSQALEPVTGPTTYLQDLCT